MHSSKVQWSTGQWSTVKWSTVKCRWVKYGALLLETDSVTYRQPPFSNCLCFVSHCFLLFLTNPRGAGLHEAFQILSVRKYVHPYLSTLVCVLSYRANIHLNPNIFTDAGPLIKWPLGRQIRGAPDPLNLLYWVAG